MIHKLTHLALLVLSLALPTTPVRAADVVLALDRSLSMKGNDPNRYSIKGAQLFSELLGADNRLALTSFAQDGTRLLPLTALSDSRTRERFSSQLDEVRMDGIRTNFEAALRTAYQIYADQSPDPTTERILILFSDGQLNLGTEAANEAARDTLLNELIPRYRAAGIRIHGVAFSPGADLPFLRLLADATGGQAFRAATPEDIYDAFVRLFEQTGQPLTTPVIDGAVEVDANVSELTLLVKREAGEGPMRLTKPSGQTLSAADHELGLDWKSTSHFDRVTIQKPEAGSWKVTSDNPDKKAYIESDLDLDISLPALARLDEPVTLVARLTDRGGTADPGLLKTTQFAVKVSDESGTIHQQLALKPGSAGPSTQDQTGVLRFTTPGIFQVQISALGPDFQRHKAQFITIVAGAPAPAQPEAPQPAHQTPPAAQPADEPRTSEHDIQRSAFFIIVSANLALLALVSIGLGAWWWHRHKRSEPSDDADPGE